MLRPRRIKRNEVTSHTTISRFKAIMGPRHLSAFIGAASLGIIVGLFLYSHSLSTILSQFHRTHLHSTPIVQTTAAYPFLNTVLPSTTSTQTTIQPTVTPPQTQGILLVHHTALQPSSRITTSSASKQKQAMAPGKLIPSPDTELVHAVRGVIHEVYTLTKHLSI